MRLILAALLVLIPSVALAQALPCGWAEDNERILRDRYQEVPVSVGTIDERSQLRIYASPDGKSWTALVITIDGMACFFTTGQDWKQGQLPKPGKKI